MKIIDISRELFSAAPYPGDPAPRRDLVRRMDMGDDCNLSGFYACCHSATHLDAPLHFIDGGDSVDKVALGRCIGPCTVAEASGIVTGADIDRLAPRSQRRILFKGGGGAFLSQSAAFALADAGFLLVGTDAASVGAPDDEAAPHRELLGAGVPLLEGLDLSRAEPGDYRLIALPLLLGGAEAAPVRAVLLRE
ncbi:MAG TPA: cyclase [Ruminococcaceae bacterium]|jgi:arylformamidase|nr:cyclase [Oscillospiraceae bacterium]HBQ47131.1 cyclase [Oscillospiraceae bacterium]HBT90673.1 cyclase [Oscillospiraceae bacterium]HCB90324.1 cyclase [Oscillospiraceae bacterium]